MATKRKSIDVLPIRSENGKRTKTETVPSIELRSNSSEETAVSEASALRDSPEAEGETEQSSVSSASSSEEEDEVSEESEQDSDEDVEGEEEEETSHNERITLGGPVKPEFDRALIMEKTQTLLTKLQEFMPKLRAANGDLEKKRGKLNIEDVEEGERYIEMNLGLGVLEEQKEEEVLTETKGEGEEEEEEEEEKTEDVMRDLLGMKNESVRPSIEEVPAAQASSQAHSEKKPKANDLSKTS